MKRLLAVGLVLLAALPAHAHVADHPSIHDTMAAILQRFRATMDADQLAKLDAEEAVAALSVEERHILGTEYWSFAVDVPATLYVLRYERQREMPFWLEPAGFEKTSLFAVADGLRYEAWKKPYAAGRVGLGINGVQFNEAHYFLALQPQDPDAKLTLSDMYPGRHRATRLKLRAVVHQDETDSRIEEASPELLGTTLVRAIAERGEESQLVRVFRTTPYTASKQPGQVVLTWSGDPQTTQAIQWRTSPEVSEGLVRYQKKGGGEPREASATLSLLEDPYLANDAINHRFTAVLDGLEAGQTYTYQVGGGTAQAWSEAAEFTTAPANTVPFSFVYMGDAQNGLEAWGDLLHKAQASQPDAAFHIMAGDLVNRGNQRDDWDLFFHSAAGVYDGKQLVPAIGNHECQGDQGPWMYLSLFDLPKNGPEDAPPERAYAFEYSNALFVILDSNLPAHHQTGWLEEQLAGTKATWKFVAYHHPAYSSKPNRDNPLIRKHWGALFDKYHVDMALQGHDHAYLRSYPMNNGQAVESANDGTIYIVSTSGTKYYELAERDYAAHGMENTSTYQVLDIQIQGKRLTYRAYDNEGQLRDEFVIEK